MNAKITLFKTKPKNRLNKYLVLIAMLLSVGVWGQVTIFSENIGTGTGTQTIAATTFQNSSLVFSGTGDTRTTSVSSGYTGASGGKNVFITNTIGTDFVISGIDTSAYTSLTLTFGELKSATSTANLLVVEVSTDGSSYTALSYSRTDGAVWALISPTGTIPSTSNLRIRFRNPATTHQFRVDDIVLKGIISCAAPTVTASAASNIATSTTDLTGNVTNQGGATINTRGFEYSTSSAMASPSTRSQAFTATGSYTLGLTSLTPNTKYYYRAYAINDCTTPQTGYSHTSAYPSFTTLSNAPATTAATGITTTGFQANWTAPTGGGSESFTYEIQIDNNSDFSSPEVSQAAIASANLNYSTSALSSGTLYYYRVRTLNATGNSAWSNTTTVTTDTPAIPVVTSETFNGTVGTSFSASITATNSPTSYSYTGTLPGGLTFNTATGAITGTPTTATVSSVSISVTATNGVGPSAPATISFNIAKGNQVITGLLTTQSKVYGDADYTLSAAASSGLSVSYLSSDTTVATVTGNTVSIKKVGTTTITASQAGDSNWNAATNATQTLTITAKNLTISGLSGVSKVYDRTTTVTLTGTPVLGTIVSGDDVTLSGTPVSNFANFNVGNGKGITVTGYTLTGTQATNYTVSQPTGLTADVTAKALTLTSAAASNKTYDGTNAAVISGNLTGIISPDVVTLSGTGTFASANAGTGIAVTSTSTLTGANAGNYTLTQPTGLTANITKATPVFTTSAINVSTGGTYALPGSISSTSDGAITYSITSGGFATLTGTTINGIAAGSETLTVNQEASANYDAASTTVSVTVSTITYVNGDWMSRSDGGTWDNRGTGTTLWKKRVSGAWVDQASGIEPSGTADSYTVYIANVVTIPTTTTALGTSKLYIMKDGNLDFSSSGLWTFRNIIVDNGGTLQATTRFTTLSSGNFEIKDGGTFVFNYASNAMSSTSVTSSILAGIEIFHPNSNFIIKNHDTGSGIYVLPPAASISANTFNGVTAYFGNFSVQKTDIRLAATNLSSTSTYLTHGNLEFSSIGATTLFYGTGTWIVGGDLKLNNTLTGNVTVTSGSTVNINVKGNVVNNSANNLRIVSAAGTSVLAVDKDIILNSGALDLNGSSGGAGTVNLKGNLTVASSASLLATNATTATFNFAGTGDGLTAATTQTIDIASTGATRTTNIAFNVNAGAYVKLINQDLALGNNSKFNVAGTLDFGFSGTTPLNVIPVTSSTGTAFSTSSGSILKITSADGISKTGATSGNVRTATSTYNNVGTYHFIGALTPQSTGNAFENTGTAAALNLVINKDNATDVVNLNTNTKTTGELNIIKGTFVETESSKIAGTTGKLTMSADATYRTAVTSANTPQLSGTYTLATGSTIELNANTNQTFNASNTITYRNLIFSNGGTKTIGNTNENILGTVTIKDNTTVDASSNTFGGAGTNLTMSDTSKLILGSGTDPKPRMDGVYNLGSASTIEFTGASSTQIRVQTTSTNPIPYAKVIVSGNNVKAGTTNATGLTFQSGGVFTVTGTGVYKVPNPAGFSGGTVTSIKNTNNPTINLETGSTIEYNATADQTITVGTVAIPATGNYQNLAISGSGTKSPVASLTVNNLVKMTGGILKITGTAENAPANVLYAYKGIDNTNSAGTVIFENNAQLLQDADAVNIGNIESQRLASNINNVTSQMDYIYWSSPVSGQDLKQFSPGTPTNRIYQYNESTDYFAAVNFATEPNFIAGKGYAFRAESTVTNGSSKTYSFTGKPNNGTIDINVNRSANSSTGVVHGYNLVGNPYPSNINFDELYLGNSSVIWNTAYFWTNNSFTSTQMGSGYTPNNYAIYNGTGGNAATSAASGVGVTAVPNGIVKVGQGFIIQKKNLGSSVLEFKNSYSATNILRVPDTGAFFEKGVSKNRFWLEMLAPNNLVNSILVGYIPGATNDFETDFDGELFVVGSDSFYSVLGAKKLAIQGRSGDFSTEDVVPLGNVYSAAGNYTIKLKDPEGIFTNNQTVYLRDKLLNKYINLNSAGSYTFAVTKGTNNTRFEIVYKEDAVLGTGNESKSEFIVYRDGNEFVIKSSKSLGKVEVYDAAGRMVVTQKTNDKILRLNVSTLNEGVFIIKAENSGDIKTKKILK